MERLARVEDDRRRTNILGTTHFSQSALALENEIDILSPKSQIVRVLADGFSLVYGLLPPAGRKFRPAMLSTG